MSNCLDNKIAFYLHVHVAVGIIQVGDKGDALIESQT